MISDDLKEHDTDRERERRVKGRDLTTYLGVKYKS